jgi:hypothetical protein
LSPRIDPADVDTLVRFAADRYLESGGLFGTPADGRRVVERLAGIGVDEIGCLIDFGLDPDDVLRSLHHVAELQTGTGA